MDSTANNLMFYDGTAWVSCRSAGALTPATTVTTEAVGDAPVVGVSTNYAREDHKHGRESFGNVTAETAFGSASTNGSAVTVSHSDHQHGNPVHDAGAHSALPISTFAAATTTINMGGFRITNMADPTAATDAATKQYTDNAIAGLSWKDSVRVATTANITLSGTQTIDGVAVVAGDRVLVKNQTTASGNGVYVCAAGAWSRSTDADAATELQGMAVYVEEGTTQNTTSWTLTTDPPITVGTTNLAYAQFGGGAAYTAGAGLTLTGNVFDVGAGNGIIVDPDSIRIDSAWLNSSWARHVAIAVTGTSSPEVLTHNLNTRDIHLTVYNGASPYTAVEVDWDSTTLTTATIRYSPNLGSGYRAVIIG